MTSTPVKLHARPDYRDADRRKFEMMAQFATIAQCHVFLNAWAEPKNGTTYRVTWASHGASIKLWEGEDPRTLFSEAKAKFTDWHEKRKLSR